MSEILDTLITIYSLARDSLLDPASNPVGAIFALALVTLVLLIGVVALFFLLSLVEKEPSSGDARVASDGANKTEISRSESAWRHHRHVVVVFIAIAVPIALLGYSSTDRFCASCHFTESAFSSLAQGPHASVSCRACHEAGGASGYVAAKFQGLSNIRIQLSGSRSGLVPSAVSDAGCLGCHDYVLTEVITARGINMRHSDVVNVGYSCIECHNTEAHGSHVARPRYPSMRYCVVCHDGAGQNTGCATCHAEDTGVAVRRLRRPLRKTDVVVEDCRGCHEVDTCNECHGLELPHTIRFVEGYHALNAYVDRDTCLKCHDMYRFCNESNCHNFRAGLVSEDGLSSVAEQHGPTFFSTHSSHTQERCEGCHATSNLCEFCHGDVPDH